MPTPYQDHTYINEPGTPTLSWWEISYEKQAADQQAEIENRAWKRQNIAPELETNDIFIPITTTPWKHGEQASDRRLRGITAFATQDISQERLAEAEEIFGQIRHDPTSETSYRNVGRALCANGGERFEGNPSLYIIERGREMGISLPQHWGDDTDLYTAIGQAFTTRAREQAQIDLGFDSLIVGWKIDAPYFQTTKSNALKAFGENWVRLYENSGDKQEFAKRRFEVERGRHDWKAYQEQRKPLLGWLFNIAEEEEEAYQEQLREYQLQQRQELLERVQDAAEVFSGVLICGVLLFYCLRHARAIARAIFHPLSLACCALLLLAFAELPYGYYTFLRLILCAWGVIFGLKWFQTKPGGWASLLCLLVAILYNPVFKVHFEREEWQWINGGTIIAILAVTAAFSSARGKDARH